jgi:EAL domain-containing protein (putative c-di-GMP-specific phosphodiesterase class I)
VRDWSTRHAAVADLTATVNISPVQLGHPRLVEDVVGALRRSGIRADRLVLEITEGAAISENPATEQQIADLRSLGVRLAIDDFGTGYSSLSQLRRLPFDMLKIDKSFIDDAADDAEGTALLHSIIELGRVLNLEILAEGIERLDQSQELRRSNAHLGQGYLYARPLPPSAMEDLMRAGFVQCEPIPCSGSTASTDGVRSPLA